MPYLGLYDLSPYNRPTLTPNITGVWVISDVKVTIIKELSFKRNFFAVLIE